MRWAIAPVIGTGGWVGDPPVMDPYRLKVAEYGGHIAIIPGNADGTPAFDWGLARIVDDAVAAADADPQITVFPQLALDHVLTLAQRNWLVTRLTNHGLPSGWVTAGITVLQVLRTIGRWLDDRFDVDWLRSVG